MAGFGFLGALSGASGQALDAIKRRQDQAAEERKARLLEELRRDTAVYLADYKEKLEADDVDSNLSSFDPTTGEFVSRNKEGAEIGRRKDAGMLEEYEFGKKKNQLSLDALSANIEQSRASADASRASASVSRKSLSALEAGENPTTTSRAQEILYRNKKIVDDLVDSGVPAEAITLTAMRSLQNAAARNQSPAEAEKYFISAADILRDQYSDSEKNTNKRKYKMRNSLDFLGE